MTNGIPNCGAAEEWPQALRGASRRPRAPRSGAVTLQRLVYRDSMPESPEFAAPRKRRRHPRRVSLLVPPPRDPHPRPAPRPPAPRRPGERRTPHHSHSRNRARPHRCGVQGITISPMCPDAHSASPEWAARLRTRLRLGRSRAQRPDHHRHPLRHRVHLQAVRRRQHCLLADEHKLAYSDELRKYIPEMPDYGAPITIDNLMRHTSGLRDYTGLLTLAGHTLEEATTDSQALASIVHQRHLNFPPAPSTSTRTPATSCSPSSSSA